MEGVSGMLVLLASVHGLAIHHYALQAQRMNGCWFKYCLCYLLDFLSLFCVAIGIRNV